MANISAAEKTKRAQARADEIKEKLGNLAESVERLPALVIEAYKQKDWEKLGHPTWEKYVKDEFETHLLKVERSLRRKLTHDFKANGMSTREIAVITNVNQATVVRDANASRRKAIKAPKAQQATAAIEPVANGAEGEIVDAEFVDGADAPGLSDDTRDLVVMLEMRIQELDTLDELHAFGSALDDCHLKLMTRIQKIAAAQTENAA